MDMEGSESDGEIFLIKKLMLAMEHVEVMQNKFLNRLISVVLGNSRNTVHSTWWT